MRGICEGVIGSKKYAIINYKRSVIKGVSVVRRARRDREEHRSIESGSVR